MLAQFFEDARQWAQGKSPVLRVVLWGYLVFLLVKYAGDVDYQSIFKPLNLGIHELGHILLIPLAMMGSVGEFVEILGGSLAQTAAPIVGIGMFLRQRDYFGVAVGLGWLATNLFEVATYVADARTMALTLVSPFGADAVHDWNYILGRLGMLKADIALATALRILAFGALLAGIAFGTWLLIVMFRGRERNIK